MSSTAAVQVCVDAGEGADIARRWAAVHAFGPVLLAAFANSPRLHGRRTGWKSSRWACWMRAEPARTAPPPPADIAGAGPGGGLGPAGAGQPGALRAPRRGLAGARSG